MTGTEDIQELKRLAEAASATTGRGCKHWTHFIAAASPDTILALIEENERLREALAEIARHDNTGITGPGRQQADSCVQIARAALKEATDV